MEDLLRLDISEDLLRLDIVEDLLLAPVIDPLMWMLLGQRTKMKGIWMPIRGDLGVGCKILF